MTPTLVLIVEDERQIRRFLRLALEAEGYEVVEAETGAQALVDCATRNPAVVILDLGLPDQDGVQVVHALRAWSETPVIVLSARNQEHHKIEALDAGADDYLAKPFGVGELLARVRASVRRTQAAGPPGAASECCFGEVRVDLVRQRVFRGGAAVHLTRTEYRLLSVLIRHAGKVLTHRQLLKEVWGAAYTGNSHYLRVHMSHLRQKLEANPAEPRYLMTETGTGYRLCDLPFDAGKPRADG